MHKPTKYWLYTIATITLLLTLLYLSLPSIFAIISTILLSTLGAPFFLLTSTLLNTTFSITISIVGIAAYLYLLITFITTKRTKRLKITFTITTIIYTLSIIASWIVMIKVLDVLY
jgi:hypothetical protein